MDQHVFPYADHADDRRLIARIRDFNGGLPRMFAIPADAAGTGEVASWGLEFPDGTAVTCLPGGAIGSWENPVNAAKILGRGAEVVYICGPHA